jgi:glycosyltransferase involved in cell wall biosynthesis
MTTPSHGVTVVVPACNVERYLGPCLDSVIAQSVWADCRVLVIDDGSTDGTADVADDYAARHPSISVVHQPNAGPGAGAARNRGLDLVQTEFVYFLDGDDELAPGAIEALREGLVAEDLDLAVGATEQFPESRDWIWSGSFVAGERGPVRIEDVPLLAHDARTCDKLYRTAWLRSLGVRFAEGIHHQDTVVNVPAMLWAERIFLVGEVVYRYRKRDDGGSVMDSHYTRMGNYWDHLQVIEELNAMRPRFSPTREPLMQAFIARSFQGFSWRAPSVLPTGRLREFFDRAAAVVGALDPEAIMAGTRGPRERAAYVTMREHDFASFERLDDLCDTIAAHDGDLYLGVPASPASLPMLQLGATRALATELSADRTGVRIRIRLRLLGTERPGPSVARTMMRALSGEDVVFGAGVEWTAEDGRESVGEALIPWSKLADGGEYQLRLQFHTATGSARRWLRRPADGEEGWEPPIIVQDRYARLRLAAGTQGRAVLAVTPTLQLRARLLAARLRRSPRRVGA